MLQVAEQTDCYKQLVLAPALQGGISKQAVLYRTNVRHDRS